MTRRKGHLVMSLLGLALVLMLRPFFPKFVMCTGLLSFEHTSVLLFSLLYLNNKIQQDETTIDVRFMVTIINVRNVYYSVRSIPLSLYPLVVASKSLKANLHALRICRHLKWSCHETTLSNERKAHEALSLN